MPTPSDPRIQILYDGSCPLCRAEMALYRARDRDRLLCPVDISKPGRALPPGLDQRQAMARLHVVAPDGPLQSGFAAFTTIWRAVPGWRGLGRLARWPGVPLLGEGLYRLFLRLRPLAVRLFLRFRGKGGGAS